MIPTTLIGALELAERFFALYPQLLADAAAIKAARTATAAEQADIDARIEATDAARIASWAAADAALAARAAQG